MERNFEYYEILNSIKPMYLREKEPFNIIQSDVIPTYNEIFLKYIKNQNFFISDTKKKKGGFDSHVTIFFI